MLGLSFRTIQSTWPSIPFLCLAYIHFVTSMLCNIRQQCDLRTLAKPLYRCPCLNYNAVFLHAFAFTLVTSSFVAYVLATASRLIIAACHLSSSAIVSTTAFTYHAYADSHIPMDRRKVLLKLLDREILIIFHEQPECRGVPPALARGTRALARLASSRTWDDNLLHARDEAQVRDGAFVCDEPRLLSEHVLEHAPHTQDLLPVPFERARDRLWMVQLEPGRLSEVRPVSSGMSSASPPEEGG